MRIELIHPMFVGFPIAFLLLGSALRLLAAFSKSNSMTLYSRYLLALGIVFGIFSIITGTIAHHHVHDMLCDHDVVDDHQYLGYSTVILYVLALFFDWNRNRHPLYGTLSNLIYCIAPFFLIMTGFLGGSLVFDQGAGVEKVCTGSAAPHHENLKTGL